MRDELDGMELEEAQRERALLCAYVLGELEAGERVEVEARLAASAELRAEKERLEATLGLVTEALAAGANEELPPSASATIQGSAIARRASRRWYASSWVRVAAAAVLLVGGTLHFQSSRTEMELAQVALKTAPAAGDLGGALELSASAPAAGPGTPPPAPAARPFVAGGEVRKGQWNGGPS